MLLKINTIKLELDSFTVQYADKGNIITINHKNSTASEVKKIEAELKKDNCTIAFLKQKHILKGVTTKETITKTNSEVVQIKLRLRF